MKDTPQSRYDKKNRVPVMLMLNKKTDADILDRLEAIKASGKSKQGYIKSLIREDIERSQNNV